MPAILVRRSFNRNRVLAGLPDAFIFDGLHYLWLIVIGLGLGLGAAVPIGPVNVEIARRTLQRGRTAGLALGFGAVTVDVLFAIGTSFGLSRFFDKKMLDGPFGYVGVGICFLLAAFSLGAGYRAWKYGVKEPENAENGNSSANLAGDYFVGFGMTALNIYTWIWWLLTVPGLAAQHGAKTVGEAGGAGATWDLPITCVGVFIAAAGWVVAFTSIVNAMRRFAGRAWHIGADVVGGVLLLAFGFWALWRLLWRPL